MLQTTEEWKSIRDFPEWEVSNTGKLRQTNDHKLLYSKVDKVGCEVISGGQGYKGKTRIVHRLVAIAFIENPEDKPRVTHIDGDKENNNASNLMWCTSEESQEHTAMIKLSRLGIDVCDLVRRFEHDDMLFVSDLARRYKVSYNYIAKLLVEEGIEITSRENKRTPKKVYCYQRFIPI